MIADILYHGNYYYYYYDVIFYLFIAFLKFFTHTDIYLHIPHDDTRSNTFVWSFIFILFSPSNMHTWKRVRFIVFE